MPNRLKQLREDQGLSLVALAAKVGTSSQQISHLELGKRHLTVEWLTRLGEALGCHPWSIVSDEHPFPLSERDNVILRQLSAMSDTDRRRLFDILNFVQEQSKVG